MAKTTTTTPSSAQPIQAQPSSAQIDWNIIDLPLEELEDYLADQGSADPKS